MIHIIYEGTSQYQTGRNTEKRMRRKREEKCTKTQSYVGVRKYTEAWMNLERNKEREREREA